MFYDQFAATPEEGLARNPLLPHGRRRAHNMTWLFVLGVWLQLHVVMIVILIITVKRGLRKV